MATAVAEPLNGDNIIETLQQRAEGRDAAYTPCAEVAGAITTYLREPDGESADTSLLSELTLLPTESQIWFVRAGGYHLLVLWALRYRNVMDFDDARDEFVTDLFSEYPMAHGVIERTLDAVIDDMASCNVVLHDLTTCEMAARVQLIVRIAQRHSLLAVQAAAALTRIIDNSPDAEVLRGQCQILGFSHARPRVAQAVLEHLTDATQTLSQSTDAAVIAAMEETVDATMQLVAALWNNVQVVSMARKFLWNLLSFGVDGVGANLARKLEQVNALFRFARLLVTWNMHTEEEYNFIEYLLYPRLTASLQPYCDASIPTDPLPAEVSDLLTSILTPTAPRQYAALAYKILTELQSGRTRTPSAWREIGGEWSVPEMRHALALQAISWNLVDFMDAAKSSLRSGGLSTGMRLAIMGGDLETVRTFLDAAGDSSLSTSEFVRLAFDLNQIEIAQYLLSRGGKYQSEVTTPDARPPLIVEAAQREGGLPFLQLLVESGADVNEVDPNTTNNFTALLYGCQLGYYEQVVFLLDHGATFHRARGLTPLHIAIRSGHANIVRVLLAHCGLGNEVLQHAGSLRFATPGMRALGDADDEFCNSPLMMAARQGSPEIVRMLLDYGADPKYKNKGHTALHWAIKHDGPTIPDPRLAVCKLLLDYGAVLRDVMPADEDEPVPAVVTTLQTYVPMRRFPEMVLAPALPGVASVAIRPWSGTFHQFTPRAFRLRARVLPFLVLSPTPLCQATWATLPVELFEYVVAQLYAAELQEWRRVHVYHRRDALPGTEGGAGGGGAQAAAPGLIDMPDLHHHPLRRVRGASIYPHTNGQWVCDLCLTPFGPRNETAHCDTCRWDACPPCLARFQTPPAAATAAPQTPTAVADVEIVFR